MATSCKCALALLGPGVIGKALMSQLLSQSEVLLTDAKIALAVVAVANSRKMLLSNSPLGKHWNEDFEVKASPTSLPDLVAHLLAAPAPVKVVVDCSASDSLPEHYVDWMQQGLHIITPNKKFGAGPLARYQRLRDVMAQTGRHFMYEATVGAGLPVISTLRSMMDTGDQIMRIEGVLSGTLSYIFNTVGPGVSFSEVVLEAKRLGYTEPDPREDLSGMDVARKVIILARSCGMKVSLEDLEVESLVPPPLKGLATAEEFLHQLPQYDAKMAAKIEEASGRGEVIRYIGTIDAAQGSCAVRLMSVPRQHPLAQLSGTDNLIAFTTTRYKDTQLIVRGPGAGPEVTAAGVFSDLLQVCYYGRGRS